MTLEALKQLDERIEASVNRIRQLQHENEALAKRLAESEQRFAESEQRFNEISERFNSEREQHESERNEVKSRIESILARFDGLDLG